jgi:antibiotic biosynthesis monooxygenase (ABM) superfamily enzyme
LSGYVISTFLITLTIVVLVVYWMMPFATRLFSAWLTPDPQNHSRESEMS